MSEHLRAAIRDGNAMRAARAKRRLASGGVVTGLAPNLGLRCENAIICGGSEEDRRRMAEWLRKEDGG